MSAIKKKLANRLKELSVTFPSRAKPKELEALLKKNMDPDAFSVYMFCLSKNTRYLEDLSDSTLLFLCKAADYALKYDTRAKWWLLNIQMTVGRYCNSRGIKDITSGKWYLYSDGSCKSDEDCNKIRRLLRDNYAHFKILQVKKRRTYLARVLPKPQPNPPYVIRDGKYIGGYTEVKKIVKEQGGNITLPSAEDAITTFFSGTEEQNYMDFLYLMARHGKNLCVVLPDRLADGHSLRFYEFDGKFVAPKNYWEKWRKCTANDKRYITSMLYISYNKRNYAHANILIYDKKTKELERYDPNTLTSGAQTSKEKMGKYIDRQTIKEFERRMGQDFISEYIPPLLVAGDVYGIQAHQFFENEMKKTDPLGFCSAWVTWFADLRLSNPDKRRQEVLKLAQAEINNTSVSLTTYIRNYSNFLAQLKRKLLNTHPKQRKKLVAYWIEKYGE